MSDYTPEELKSVIVKFKDRCDRVEKVYQEQKAKLATSESQLAAANSELTQLREMESILQEETMSLKQHVNNFSIENTTL